MNTQEKIDFAGIASLVSVNAQKFIQYTSVEYAKKMLQEKLVFRKTPFTNIEKSTPEECKNLSINYSFAKILVGDIIVASTSKGICYMAFTNNENEVTTLETLQKRFPNAKCCKMQDEMQQKAISAITQQKDIEKIKLHLIGTVFQLSVWETLLKIPTGKLTTYGDIAKQLKNPKASRAVGTAVGSNPISIIVPCHRVIRASGGLGGYHWGLPNKIALIGREASLIN